MNDMIESEDNVTTQKTPCRAHSMLNGGTLSEYQSWCPLCRAATLDASVKRNAQRVQQIMRETRNDSCSHAVNRAHGVTRRLPR